MKHKRTSHWLDWWHYWMMWMMDRLADGGVVDSSAEKMMMAVLLSDEYVD